MNNSSNKRILVIDDNQDNRTIVQAQLEAENFEVISIEDPLEGLEKARNWRPDLIILDIMMPKMDGYRLCRLLKFDNKTKQIPIVLLTALFADQKKEEGKNVGADAYIVKPFVTEEHMHILDDLLRSKD